MARGLRRDEILRLLLDHNPESSDDEHEPLDDQDVAEADLSSDDSEEEPTSEEEDVEQPTDIANVSKSGIQWYKYSAGAAQAGRAAIVNVMHNRPGPVHYATSRIRHDSPLSAWRLLFDEPMLRKVQNCTVERAHSSGYDDWDVSLRELEKFIGLMYARGILSNTSTPVHDLWSSTWKCDIFPKTMARNRFCDILRFLRLDVKTTRRRQLEVDRFALASDIWCPFISNCTRCYNPHENLTIDEQLLPCKCRCPFIQYMGNKPDKFGLKFFHIVDNRTKYLCNGFPYLGKDETRPANESLSLHVVKRLTKPYLNGGYNITADNFFSSMAVVRFLFANKLSYHGTVRMNCRDILCPLQLMKDQPLYSSIFFSADSGHVSLTVYKAKRSKNVAIISSAIPRPKVLQVAKLKPDTITKYNETKCGVDSMDQMTRLYTTRRTCRRWPVYVLYNILDIALINAWVLYKETLDVNISRRDYALQLITELCNDPVLVAPVAPVPPHTAAPKRKHCQIEGCSNKTATFCHICKKSCCGKCTSKTIITCTCKNC